MSIIFGLDFGTSNSALSANIDGKFEMLNIDNVNPTNMSLKSVLYFCNEKKETKVYVGSEAIKKYIENESQGRYLQSIKSFLPDITFSKTKIFSQYYTLDDLIAFILKNIKSRGEEIVNCTVNDVIIGRPVIFSEDKERDKLAEDRLVSAAKKAGFKNIQLQLEPIAAALSYKNTLNPINEKIILVGDFGGGTSDFTIIKIGRLSRYKFNYSKDVLSIGGVGIGGDTFDSIIMWEKVASYFGKNVLVKSPFGANYFGISAFTLGKLKRWNLIPLLRAPMTLHNIREVKYLASNDDKKLIENLENLINYNFGYLLYQSIERAKCELSNINESNILFNDYGIYIKETITKFVFEEIIAAEVERIEKCIDKTVLRAGLSNKDIDIVVLTGGSSFIPFINNIFQKKFGLDKIRQSDAFTSVAYGLGIYSTLI